MTTSVSRNETGRRAFAVGGTIYKNRLVKLSSGTVVHNTATATDEFLGASLEDVTTSEAHVTVDLKTRPGTHILTAAGAIAAGAVIYAAADGKVQALPETAGTYRRVGQNMEIAATDDGNLIEALLDQSYITATVSS